jgi:polyisoprenoid-binding protein YceI
MNQERRRPATISLRWALIMLVVVAVVVVGGPFVFFHFVEGSSPAPLRLPSAGSAKSGAPGPGSGPLVPGPVTGTWTASTGSQAGYRVEEVLFGQQHTAVGRTTKVSGKIVISGATVTSAAITVDMASVKSDQPSRDAQFDGHIMETYKYPDATFRLTAPIDLGSIVPAVGSPISVRATGDLSLRGDTQSVTFSLSAERVESGIDVNAEIPVTFSRWHIPNPSFAVAQVGSTGDIEVLLDLVSASAAP